MRNKSTETTDTLELGHDCTLRNIRSISDNFIQAIEDGKGIELDCANVEHVDISFVQLIVSTQRACATRRQPFSVATASPALRAAFERAAISLSDPRSLASVG